MIHCFKKQISRNHKERFQNVLFITSLKIAAPPAAPPLPPANPPAAPPAPPAAPPMITGIPPPPPPPMPSGNGGGPEPVSGLAAALQAAKLRKTAARTPNENSGGSTTSSAGSSGYGSIGKGKEERPPMASMMDEMQKTLARRRAKVEKGDEVKIFSEKYTKIQ